MSTLTPEERTQRARLAAQVRWSRHDPVAGTEPARRGFNEKFIDEVDPDRILPEAERVRRAESARKAFYTRLAYRSAVSRRRGGDAA